MRELKFRAWDTENKEFIYEAQATYDNACRGLGSLHHENFQEVLEDDSLIVEQYTGLKDKNGKEIYEGDIIKLCGKVAEYKCALYRVFWESVYAAFDLVALEKDKSDVGYLNEVETESRYKVIGNIHENPELIEDEE